ncbi:hypothetical protein QCA50_000198 [Cerrena zonata]|uniref:Uncharacterized protein n=1 Tax=Cerrena zonata TaxID=2478898 RepID=A0AAW0GYK4_9APHY
MSTNTTSAYHRVPSEPEVSRASDEFRLGDSDEQESTDEFIHREAALSTDSRVRWIHFILGCAVLLPWNAMITAIPYFVARLNGSPFKSTFGSSLTTTFTVANFVFLAHATATVKKASNARRGFVSIICLAALVGLLTLSTYVHVAAGLFFAFVLLNAIAQAAAGSYLQTAIVAVASLFGPSAMQSVMSGQGAVGVAISLVQAISAYTSVHSQSSSETDVTLTSEPEERSAFMFFSISTFFLLVSAGAQAWLFRLPAYKSIIGQFNHISHEEGLETSNLVPHAPTTVSAKDRRSQIIRVAKTNGHL